MSADRRKLVVYSRADAVAEGRKQTAELLMHVIARSAEYQGINLPPHPGPSATQEVVMAWASDYLFAVRLHSRQ